MYKWLKKIEVKFKAIFKIAITFFLTYIWKIIIQLLLIKVNYIFKVSLKTMLIVIINVKETSNRLAEVLVEPPATP